MNLTSSPVVCDPFAVAFGFLLALCLGLAGCASPPLASGHAATPSANLPRLAGNAAATAPSPGLRQFTAGGHVLGFAAGSVLVATGSHALQVEFVNANPVDPQSDQPGGDGKDHQAPALSEVRYPGLWQGIDLAYRADPSGIAETVWKLEPGADIRQARLRYNRPLTLNPDGSLNIRYPTGSLIESAPVAWQIKDGRRQPVTVAFALNGAQELGFTLGDHDPALPVWIDPTLSWNTFLGSTGTDEGNAIAVDGSGNIYVTGSSFASWGNPLRAYGGYSDAFVAKLDNTGQLIWSTFLGGAQNDLGYAIGVDGSGNVYVVGNSYVTWGSPLRAFGGGLYDAFAAKLDSTGALVWNTFLGGADFSDGKAIVVDGSGNVYVTGTSGETWGSPLRAFNRGNSDAYIAKLDNKGQLVWNTFLGGAGTDYSYGIALDSGGNVYVAGSSGTTWGNPQQEFGGSGDSTFAAKLDSFGTIVWNTFLGYTSQYPWNRFAIAVDSGGNVYVAGSSGSTWGSPQRAHSGGDDAFAVKLNSTGQLVWHTFLGGISTDLGNAIAVDGSGNVFVAGYSRSTWGNPLRAFSGSTDAFAAQIDSTGKLIWNTFLGGASGDFSYAFASGESGYAIAVDGGGNVYVAGYSESTWGSPQRAFSGYDAFVAKLDNHINTATAVTSNANPATYGQTVTFTATVTPATATGTVTFKADGNAITGCGTNGVVNLSGGSAACASAALTATGSPHAIAATYNGDATYATSSGSLASGQTVNKADATVTTWPAASAITYGQSLANSTLSGGAATPAGSFAFTTPATAPPVGTAAQSVTYTPTNAGNYNTATSTVSVTVNQANQTILFGSNPTVIVGGTGTVSATGGGSGNPVQLTLQPASTGCSLGTPNPSGATTTVTVTGTGLGTCAIAANQAGNANYNAAAQATQTFSVTTGLPLTVTNANKTFGTITSDAGGIACGATCSANFINGTLVKLTASPVAGYQFSGWGGACRGYGNFCAVTMDAAKSVTARFEVFKNHRSAWKRALLMR